MRALFIGGTGIISTEITKMLAISGWELYLLNRGTKNEKLEGVDGINIINADISDEDDVRAKLKGKTFDVVADFIVFNSEQAERDIRLFADITKQYIFISSASAYQKPLSNHVITESTPLANKYWQYSRNKIVCEEIFINEYRKNNFPITIVRPSSTYDKYSISLGVHGKNGSWQILKRMMEGKEVLVLGDGSSLWTVTHSRDFAKGFIGLMGNIHAIGEAVHITTDESVTWNQIYNCVGSALGVTPKLFHVSSDFLVACNPSYEGPLLGDKSNSVIFDNTKLKRLVPGFRAEIRYDQGVRESVENYLNDISLQKEDPEFDKFCDDIISVQNEAVEAFKRREA